MTVFPPTFLGTAITLLALGLPTTLPAQHDHQHHADWAESPTENEPAQTLYQCSMHPNIVNDEPGQCPICAMDLQPVEPIGAKGIPGRAPVRLSDQQRQIINLVTAPVRREPVTLHRSFPGMLAHDSSRVFTVAAWAGGRIEALYVDETEADIEAGDPLYRIYSPDIYAAIEDFLIVYRRANPDPKLRRAARFRLEQMGLTPEQIDALAERDAPPPSVDILSRVTGKVMKKHLQEGQYVREGDNLYEVVDLSELWLIAEAYQSDLPDISVGQRVAMSLPGDSTRSFGGRIERIEHHIDPATRNARLRIVFDEAESGSTHQHAHGLLPDMWMRAELETPLGEQLTIPRSALFDTGKRQYVFVEEEPGLFVPRLVEVGARSGNRLVVHLGLEPGETVVEQGTFLLDSESLLKASASGSEEGTTASESATPKPERLAPTGFNPAAKAAMERVWARYFALSEALFDDQKEAAQIARTELEEVLGALRAESLRPAVGSLAWQDWLDNTTEGLAGSPEPETETENLQALRVSFGRMSEALKELSKEVPELRPDGLVVASCPMWHQTDGEWIQRGDQVRNPFMGQAMPACGVIERPLGAPKGGAR